MQEEGQSATAPKFSAAYLLQMKNKRKQDRQNINEFIGVIQADKDAYDLFKQQLERTNFSWAKELKRN